MKGVHFVEAIYYCENVRPQQLKKEKENRAKSYSMVNPKNCCLVESSELGDQ